MTIKDNKLIGDCGLLCVMRVLLKAGINVSIPFGDRLPYDLIVEKDGELRRVQVKTRRIQGDGAVRLKKSSPSSSSTIYSKKTIDAFAICCLDSEEVAFLNIEEILHEDFNIRFLSPKVLNKRSKFWKNYCDPDRLFNNKILCNYVLTPTANVHDPRPQRRKIDRPAKDVLLKMVWEKPTAILARELGVSDKAIEKWCKSYAISKPPRGYWAKKLAENQ